MICKETQNTIDTLLSLKGKDEICANVISDLMNQSTNNKVSSVQESTNRKIGEVAEIQALLRNFT
jgi:hypothetical protein